MNPPPAPKPCDKRTAEECTATSAPGGVDECVFEEACKPKPPMPPTPKYCDERNKDECTATPRPDNKGECLWVDDDGNGNAHGCMNPPPKPMPCD
jgi:hypothetical protein